MPRQFPSPRESSHVTPPPSWSVSSSHTHTHWRRNRRRNNKNKNDTALPPRGVPALLRGTHWCPTGRCRVAAGGGRRRAVRSGNHNKQKSLSCWCTFLPQPPLQPLTPLSMQSESLPALAVQHTSTRHTHTHKRERRLHPLARPRRAVVGSQRCAASSPASWP